MSYNQLELSYIVPVYIENEQCNIVSDLIRHYETYSQELLDKIQFVFIDDHSPVEINFPVDCRLNYIRARIRNNIQWNQGGARNLGVHLSKCSKLLLTDIDHLFPEKLLVSLLTASEPKHLYKFRRERNGEKVYSHANTFFCTKATFFKVLGVDEEFCGHYGYEDVFFTKIQKAVGTRTKYFSYQRVIHNEHKNSDAEHHHLVRDTSRNEKLLEEKISLLKKGKVYAAHSRLFLNFEWDIIRNTNG